ncbi:MAG: hypothetical protein HYX53_02080 [Chloroflexi bacterium]|nr:hypothetical protein [Chloroflexota bacterium]
MVLMSCRYLPLSAWMTVAHRLRAPRAPLSRRFSRDSSGQAGFDYLLTGGIVAVAVALAFTGLKVVIPEVVGLACPVIDSATGSAVGACITP